jgi:hypothetical protein
VIDGVTGVLYPGASAQALCAAIERFETLSFDDGALRAHAAGFAPARFATEFGRVLLAPTGESSRDRG